MNRLMLYLLNLAIGFDQMLNVLLDGAPDETLSARAHRQHVKGRSWMRCLINLLFFWQHDHCLDAFLSEMERRQFPTAYRT